MCCMYQYSENNQVLSRCLKLSVLLSKRQHRIVTATSQNPHMTFFHKMPAPAVTNCELPLHRLHSYVFVTMRPDKSVTIVLFY